MNTPNNQETSNNNPSAVLFEALTGFYDLHARAELYGADDSDETSQSRRYHLHIPKDAVGNPNSVTEGEHGVYETTDNLYIVQRFSEPGTITAQYSMVRKIPLEESATPQYGQDTLHSIWYHTISKKDDGSVDVLTGERLITYHPETNYDEVEDERLNDPADVKRLLDVMGGAESRLKLREPLNPEEEARYAEIVGHVRKAIKLLLARSKPDQN